MARILAQVCRRRGCHMTPSAGHWNNQCFPPYPAVTTRRRPGRVTKRVTLMLHTHVFSMFLAQIPRILKGDESIDAVVLHARVNDTKLRQTETLKRDFRSLIETVHSTSPMTTIIVSGPLPTYRRGHERFSRLFTLNE